MPVLIRYCLRSIWPPFFLAAGIWLFVLNLIFEIIPFLDYLFRYQAGLLNSLRLLLYIQPSFLVLVLPIAFLTAILVVYGRLSADREILAIESSGVQPSRLVWPMIGFSILMSLFLVFFMDRILPWGNTSYLKLEYEIVTERSAIIIHEREFIKDFEGYLLYVRDKDDQKDILKGVTVEFLDGNSHPYRLIQAAEGTLREDPENYHVILDLSDGVLQQLGAGKTEPSDEFLTMQFKTCALDLSSHKMSGGPTDFRDARNMSIGELAARLEQDRKQKTDSRRDETEFQKKFSIPFSALAFAFIGIPLGIISRMGSIAGPFFAVLLVLVYYFFITSGDVFGPVGVMPPFLAMWLPNGLLMLLGWAMVHWLNHRFDFWRSLFPNRGWESSRPLVSPPKGSGKK